MHSVNVADATDSCVHCNTSLAPMPVLTTDGLRRYGGLLLLAFGLSAATGSDLRFAASFGLFYVLDRKANILLLQYELLCNCLCLGRWCAVLNGLYCVAGNLQVELEEEALGKKYNEYSDYKKTAKRFVPYLY
jgi:protein-S-isoprenylcysteine O-methyltransferase Ste14